MHGHVSAAGNKKEHYDGTQLYDLGGERQTNIQGTRNMPKTVYGLPVKDHLIIRYSTFRSI